MDATPLQGGEHLVESPHQPPMPTHSTSSTAERASDSTPPKDAIAIVATPATRRSHHAPSVASLPAWRSVVAATVRSAIRLGDTAARQGDARMTDRDSNRE